MSCPVNECPWWVDSLVLFGLVLLVFSSVFTVYSVYSAGSYSILVGGTLAVVAGDLLVVFGCFLMGYYDLPEIKENPAWLSILTVTGATIIVISMFYIIICIALLSPYSYLVAGSFSLIFGNSICIGTGLREKMWKEI